MWKPNDDLEEGEYADYPEDRPSLAELKAAAQVIVYIEDHLQINVKRLRVRVRGKRGYIQGSVSSHEDKKLIEESPSLRTGLESLECSLEVRK